MHMTPLQMTPTPFAEKNIVKLACGIIARQRMPSSNMAVIGLAALAFGFLLGRWNGRGPRLSNVDNGAFSSGDFMTNAHENSLDNDLSEEGGTPIWLNYALGRLWALFQKNTKRSLEQVIQPVLDKTRKPDFVKSIRLVSFTSGKRFPYVRSLRRMPSRALADVQYSVNAIVSSTSEYTFQVDISLAGVLHFPIPVKLRDVDVDSLCLATITLAPYEPYVSSVQFALLEPPKLSFDLTLADILPITAVPVLRLLFFRIIAEEIPKQFLYPNTVSLDFTPEAIKGQQGLIKSTRILNLGDLSEEALMNQFPEQWALYDSLDMNNDGKLSTVELFAGLKDWGYTATDSSESTLTRMGVSPFWSFAECGLLLLHLLCLAAMRASLPCTCAERIKFPYQCWEYPTQWSIFALANRRLIANAIPGLLERANLVRQFGMKPLSSIVSHLLTKSWKLSSRKVLVWHCGAMGKQYVRLPSLLLV
jgi:hypothetical protein